MLIVKSTSVMSRAVRSVQLAAHRAKGTGNLVLAAVRVVVVLSWTITMAMCFRLVTNAMGFLVERMRT
jgi:hypothetical protein